jgi:predicted nucleic acid-binding OB-fold protein
MDQHRKAALEIIHEYYYALPNNGYLNHGLLSCDKRYKEATQCALIGVKRIILILEFMSTESNDPAIMDRINFYDKVQDELYQIQADNSKVTLNELPEVFDYKLSEDEAVAYFERAEKNKNNKQQ